MPPARGAGPPSGSGRPPLGRGTPPAGRGGPLSRVDWKKVGQRALWVVLLAVGAWLLSMLLAAFLPRWWAQTIGNAVDGSFSAGAWWGLMIGAVFTGLAFVALAQAVLPNRSQRVRAGAVLLALVLAIPNLLTLGVVLGTNAAAHAAERTLDVTAPGFRGGTAWGAVLGAVIALAVVVLASLFRRRGKRLKELQTP